MTTEEAAAYYATEQAAGRLPRVALSIQQPWAWLMTKPIGDMASPLKTIENRTWRRKTPAGIIVHAGKRVDPDCHRALLAGRHPVSGKLWWAGFNPYADAIKAGDVCVGGFVGAMDFTGEVLTESADAWFMGPYGYVATNGRPLPFLPWRGMLGFFPVKVQS